MQTSNAKSDSPPIIRSAYSLKAKISLTFTGNGRTKQSHKAECDINQILARYKKTGTLDFQQKHEPQYGDVTALEFQSAQLMIAEAKGLFAAMPAHLRHRFDNEPAKFLAFVQDDRNKAEAEELGLLKVKPAEPVKASAEAVPAPVVNPTAPAATPPAVKA